MHPQKYFQSYKDYFWQWEEAGKVIGIPGGRTIAYREYVIEVMEALKDRGLPNFGTLLLLLLATSRGAGPDIVRICNQIKGKIKRERDTYIREFIESGQQFLLGLARLPEDYKAGKKRLLVFQTLYKPFHSHLGGPKKAGEVVRFLKEHAFYLDQELNQVEFDASVVATDFQFLSHLLKVYPDEGYLLNEMAGLPEIEEEVPEPEEQTEGTQDFVQELLEDPRTFPVGALIRRIWSGLDIPYHHRVPAGQPLGGVSDLSNKGDLHRLLISELAHDELIFLSRLANNEALYFNREIPPQSDKQERVILIDVSIKSWGTPRAVAYALMLAIARHPKTDIPCSAFAIGDACHPLAFGNIHELIESLQLMEPSLYPAAGLERFFQVHADKRKAEVFLISPSEVLEMPAMRQAMNQHQAFIEYVLQTDALGGVSLYKKRQQGKKHLKTIQLPLKELWAKKAASKKEAVEGVFSANYPLLVPACPRPKAVLSAGSELFQVSRERKLLRRAGKQSRLWEVLFEGLPAGSGADYYDSGQMGNGDFVLMAFNAHNRELSLLNMNTGMKKVFVLEERATDFVFYRDCFYPLGYPYCFGIQHDAPVKVDRDDPVLMTSIRELYNGRKEELREAEKHITMPFQVLKNINEVFVNEAGNLVFNFHELTLYNNHFTIKMNKKGASRKMKKAALTDRNEFTFPDGSQVLVNPAGLLILKSPGGTIPAIYVPSLLDKSLGLAAGGYRSGNSEFFAASSGGESILSPWTFWSRYLHPFIKQIKQHGTTP